MLACNIHSFDKKKKKKKPSTLTQQKWHIWFISFNFALFPSNKTYQLSKMIQLTKTFTTCAAQLSQITLLFLVRAQVGLGEGNGTPLQYSCLENPMDGRAWWATVHGVAKSWTRLSNFLSLFTFMHWRRKWQPTPVYLP